jgi:hypothetical protein
MTKAILGLRLLAAMLVTLALSGCAMNLKTYDGADAGYLVASLAMAPDAMYDNVEFDFRSRDGQVDERLFWVNDAALLSPAADFREADAKGAIATVRLKPGQYEFYSFGVKRGNRGYTPRIAYSISFTVESGKVTYVGQFLMRGVPERSGSLLGETVIEGLPYFVVSNRQERDMALAKDKVPELDAFPVVTSIPDPAATRVPYFRSTPLAEDELIGR